MHDGQFIWNLENVGLLLVPLLLWVGALCIFNFPIILKLEYDKSQIILDNGHLTCIFFMVVFLKVDCIDSRFT